LKFSDVEIGLRFNNIKSNTTEKVTRKEKPKVELEEKLKTKEEEKKSNYSILVCIFNCKSFPKYGS
jgi:hypothetical protein